LWREILDAAVVVKKNAGSLDCAVFLRSRNTASLGMTKISRIRMESRFITAAARRFRMTSIFLNV
jgi:hypothetical protein